MRISRRISLGSSDDVKVSTKKSLAAIDRSNNDLAGRYRATPRHPGADAADPRQDLRLLAVLDQFRHRLRQRARDHVVECGWNHRVAPPLRCINCQSFCGVAGIATSRTPNGCSASTIAFITAGVEAIVPASPIPFVPNGFTGLGVKVAASSKDGRSDAVGIR